MWSVTVEEGAIFSEAEESAALRLAEQTAAEAVMDAEAASESLQQMFPSIGITRGSIMTTAPNAGGVQRTLAPAAAPLAAAAPNSNRCFALSMETTTAGLASGLGMHGRTAEAEGAALQDVPEGSTEGFAAVDRAFAAAFDHRAAQLDGAAARIQALAVGRNVRKSNAREPRGEVPEPEPEPLAIPEPEPEPEVDEDPEDGEDEEDEEEGVDTTYVIVPPMLASLGHASGSVLRADLELALRLLGLTAREFDAATKSFDGLQDGGKIPVRAWYCDGLRPRARKALDAHLATERPNAWDLPAALLVANLFGAGTVGKNRHVERPQLNAVLQFLGFEGDALDELMGRTGYGHVLLHEWKGRLSESAVHALVNSLNVFTAAPPMLMKLAGADGNAPRTELELALRLLGLAKGVYDATTRSFDELEAEDARAAGGRRGQLARLVVRQAAAQDESRAGVQDTPATARRVGLVRGGARGGPVWRGVHQKVEQRAERGPALRARGARARWRRHRRGHGARTAFRRGDSSRVESQAGRAGTARDHWRAGRRHRRADDAHGPDRVGRHDAA